MEAQPHPRPLALLTPPRPAQERAMLEELGLLDDVMEADAGRVRAWTKAL